ncbi:MAG: DUF1573 domain-containing protein [Bacteroidota bacterium]
MKVKLFLLVSLFFAMSCKNGVADGQSATSSKDDEEIVNIIRNPVSAVDAVDPDFVPKITFEGETIFDFGTVKEGTKVEHTFKFKNTGEVPLLIGDANTTCGCTVPTYPREYIQPGKGGEIKVIFDTKNFTGNQTKPITIVSNTYPRDTKLFMKGIVEGDGSNDHEGHNH